MTLEYASYLVTVLGAIVSILSLILAGLAGFEYWKLRQIRQDFCKQKEALETEISTRERASHRVMASYQLQNPADRVGLLESAIAINPKAFNAYNTLGYAYLDLNDLPKAIEAFRSAVEFHPTLKEGYCDLAYAYFRSDNRDLCLKYLRLALQADQSAEEDIRADVRFASVLEDLGVYNCFSRSQHT
ncbi:MAG: tetratricopeptide repeat protein [Magnetococcus sp. YQC-5]